MNTRQQAGFFQAGRGWARGLAVMVAGVMICGRCAVAETPGQEVERLRRQVDWLCESLVEAKAEVDALRAKLGRYEFEVAGGRVAETPVLGPMPSGAEYSVLEVSEELGMAVVSAGRRQGLRPGMQLAAIRGGKLVARLRIVDVRPMIAGAVIERTGREFPGVKDRVVLAVGSKE